MSNDTFNPSDEVQVARRQSVDKTRRLLVDSGFKKLMGDEAGRAWVWEHLSQCGVFRSSFDPSNARTAFNEGSRNVGLRVLADLHRLCPELYLRMLNENQPKETRNG